ncbi:MAG: NADH-quinone oxidoreductase subunit H [Armatimonadetes bacterium]|nr:NADH-quinone oxidoreductase subunit H [Armatimonadota bacterium]
MQQVTVAPVASAGLALLTMAMIAALSPLLEGSIRKLRAIVHSRQGPPIIQPYLDLAKLLIKEDLLVSRSMLLTFAPVAFLAATLLAGSLVPLWSAGSGLFAGDVLVFAYLLALATVSAILVGMATRSPYSVVGASREAMLMVGAEPVLVLSLLVVSLNAGSLRFEDMVAYQVAQGPTLSTIVAAIAYLLAMQALVAKIPFDIAEAETEIMDGPFTELSGPRLALCKLGLFCKQLIFALLFVQVFIPWVSVGLKVKWLGTLLALAFAFLINFALVGLMDAVNPRLRIDQAVRYLAAVGVVAAVALAYAALGT